MEQMTQKELLYTSDALGHAKFLSEQFSRAEQQLQDSELKNAVRDMAEQHRKIFSALMQLV